VDVTAVRPHPQRHAVSLLSDDALPALGALLEADPFVNVAVSSRIAVTRSLTPPRLGGTMLGIGDRADLRAACFSGGNLVPIGGDAAAWEAIAGAVATYPRVCTSIVGRADAVEVLWQRLEPEWGPARSIRPSQPVLVLDHPVSASRDHGVRHAEERDFENYVHAAAQMFTEELGVAPSVAPGVAAFRARVGELIRRRRAFVAVDASGAIVFKAEVGAVSRHSAQLQGVWVRPDLRGRGIATSALAAVCQHALALAPTVSLYVNDFNTTALRLYARLGMRQVATLATVLLA
jgi:hypothetical protein